MSRFLVTGSSGFVGSAIVRRLRADGHDVFPLGRKQADLLDCDPAGLAPMIEASGAGHCIHAAWYTNHADYLTHDINRAWVDASVRLAETFWRAGGQRFVGLGTCLEYDVAAADAPCSELTTPRGGETLYARCKLAVLDALTAGRQDFAWPRLFFVYGPGDRPGRLIPAMIEQFVAGHAAEPRFGGLRRDYIHVDDLAGQIVRVALSDVHGPINTGTGEAPTLAAIYAAGAAAIGRPDLARANDETGGQPPLIQADLSLLRERVGEPAARTVEQGLRDLAA